MMKTGLVVMAMLVARSAHADDTVPIETHGVEIEVPQGWSDVDKGPTTTLAPKLYKGRAIEIVSLPAMPADKAGLQKLMDAAKITINKASPADRQGVRMIVADGKMEAKDKTALDVDLVILPVDKGATLIMSFIRSDQDPILRKANEAILLSARIAGPKMSVELVETKTTGLGAPKAFVEEFRKFIPRVDLVFLFPRPLPVRFQDCGVINAFYSPVAHDIKICHELFDSLRALFKTAGLDDKRGEEMTLNTIRFAFWHEFGHALVGEFTLPITGKGEDAADELAVLMLVNEGKAGQQAALDASEWFQLNVQSHGGKVSNRTFFDEHSYDEARVGNIYCMLYGADKASYADLVKKRGMPDRRLNFCLKDYPDRLRAWNTMLEPHHRRRVKK